MFWLELKLQVLVNGSTLTHTRTQMTHLCVTESGHTSGQIMVCRLFGAKTLSPSMLLTCSHFIKHLYIIIHHPSPQSPKKSLLANVFGLWNVRLKIKFIYLYPPHNEVVGGVYWFHSVRPSVRPSRMPCPLCIIYSYGWILFILGTNDHYHERVCRAPWPLTLTYIFKVIWPWLRKSCPLCSVYSSGWILPIFGTNDHYH